MKEIKENQGNSVELVNPCIDFPFSKQSETRIKILLAMNHSF